MELSFASEPVGREAELAIADAAIRQLSDGRASALIIEGQAGIGKTCLVEKIIEIARSRDVTVLRGDAHPFERNRPFGVVAAALDLNRRSPDRRRAVIGEMLSGVSGDEPARAVIDVQYHVIEEITDLIETACMARPVLLVLEDIHWADSASLLAIWSLARQLPLAALLLLVTTRPSPPPDVARLLDDLAASGAHALQLDPLNPTDVAILARRVLGAPPGRALIGMLDKAAGNPLWTVAMLRSLAEEDALRPTGDSIDTTRLVLPDSLSELVVRRLQHLPAETLELLQITAVLGDVVSLRDVAVVANQPPARVVRQLAEAFDAELLDEAGDGVAFRHQLVHDAIYQRLPPPVRRVLHREAAVALMAAGADALQVSDHLMLGTERGDEKAIGWLREAARLAAAQAPRVAAELMCRAEELIPARHPDSDRVALETVQSLLRSGRVSEAAARAEAVLARPHAQEIDVPIRLALLGAFALTNRADELINLARSTLEGCSGLLPAEQVPILAQQSWALTYSGHPGAGEMAAGRALSIAEQAGDPAMMVWGLIGLMVAIGRQGRFDEALAHARRSVALAATLRDARALPLQPKLFLGLALVDCDLIDEARTMFRESLEDKFGSGWWFSEALVADAQASFAIGQWDDAGPGLIAGGQAAREKGNELLAAQSIAYRTIIATARADYREAGELAATLFESLAGDQLSYNAGIVAFAVAHLKAAEGDRRGAYDLLLKCWRFDMARESRFYHRWLAPDLVRLALALDHRDVAEEVARTMAVGVTRAPGVPTLHSLALRCRGLVHGEVEPLLEAVTIARRSTLLIEHTGACEDAATVLARVGRREEAAAMLGEALERYEQVGADAWARRVRSQLRRLGAPAGPRGSRNRPTSGWESLTSTEQAVSLLVTEGLTNGAIARRLFISPHTVNTHLRHVFAKLNVSNRVALAAVVHHSIK